MQKKKDKLIATVVSLLLLVGFVLNAVAAEAQVKLNFWHVMGSGSLRDEMAQNFAKRVTELTDGKVKIEVFGGGVMGDSMAELEGQKLGSNHFSLTDPGQISTFDPTKRVAVLQLPYLFDTYEQAWNFMDSDWVKQNFGHLPAQGFRLLAVWENGIRQTTNNKRPIHYPKDMQGLKLRVVKDPVMLEVMKAMGASPVPMGWTEVFTALQHGVVDGQENPIANIYFGKFFEVQKYLSLTSHQYSSVPLLISEIGWKKLSPDQQEAVSKAAHEVKWFGRKKNVSLEDEYLKGMMAKGLVVNKVDTKPFREAVATVYKHFEPVFGKEAVKHALDLAAEIRAKYPSK